METFPIPAPAFTGDSRSVSAGNAFEWLRRGWLTFMLNPGVWIAMTIIVFVIYFGLSIVPLLGQLAANLLTPLLVAGLLAACRKAENGQTLEIPDLFAGFKTNSGELAILGLLYMAGMLVIATPDTLDVRKIVDMARTLNPAIEVVLRTHSEEEAGLLRQESLGTVFMGEDELAKGMARHVLARMGKGA